MRPTKLAVHTYQAIKQASMLVNERMGDVNLNGRQVRMPELRPKCEPVTAEELAEVLNADGGTGFLPCFSPVAQAIFDELECRGPVTGEMVDQFVREEGERYRSQYPNYTSPVVEAATAAATEWMIG